MNAPRAHYVANAGAKIQPFSGLATTFGCFFENAVAQACNYTSAVHYFI